MKKMRVLFEVLCVCGCWASMAATRVASYGSNPYLSWVLFPQDIQEWPGNFISYSPSYDKLPYWGNIDNPAKKPNGTYTSTGIDVTQNGSTFSQSANIYSVTNSLGYAQRLSSGPMAAVNLDCDVDARSDRANGTIADPYGSSYAPIPFDFSMTHVLNATHLQGMLSFKAFGIPAGLRCDAGFQNTVLFDHSFSFQKNGAQIATDRSVWGWSTSGCAHIFGVRPASGDAWLQDGYARGPLYDVNLQAAVSLPLGKIGAQFGYQAGHQDYYSWQPDSARFTGDAAVDNNFIGHYQKSDWSRTSSNALIGLYGNIPWMKSDRYSLGSFGLLKYEGTTEGEALSANLDVSGDAKDKTHNLTIEAAPNISIPFGSLFNYIDVAIPVEYGYSRFNNTYLRWLGGGRIETYQDTRTSLADENSWEGYSYANRNFFDVGLDMSTMFPLLAGDRHSVGLGLLLLIDSKFTYMTKYYGHNVDQAASVDFVVDNRREDFEREIVFATGVKLQAVQRPFFGWLEVTEPLLHSLLPRTRVTDAGGGQVLYEHEKSPLWISQEGLRVGVFVTYEMTLPFLRSL